MAAVPVAPATEEANSKATAVAQAAFASPKALQKSSMAAKAIGIGPRLWAASVDARKQFKHDTKDTYGVVTSVEIVTKWKLVPLDLSSVPDDVRPVLAEAAKEGTTVLQGAIFSRPDDVLPSILLAQLKPNEFPFSVRRPTEAELTFYYALIPYDLTDPILVVESKAHAFLCHFDADTKLFFAEML
jgi:hypothetical protein